MKAFVPKGAPAVIYERGRIIIKFRLWPGCQNKKNSDFRKNPQEFKKTPNKVKLGLKFHFKAG